MTEFKEVLDEQFPPRKRRISVPETHLAVILSREAVHDVKAMCILIRRSRRLSAEDKAALQSITGDLLLALIEAESE